MSSAPDVTQHGEERPRDYVDDRPFVLKPKELDGAEEEQKANRLDCLARYREGESVRA